MDHIANNVLTAPIEKKMTFTIFFIHINLPLYYVFQAPQSLWDFFQLSSTCLVHLKIGTCSLYIMLDNNFNFHTLWDSQNPYNNILSAYEVKDETSTNKTYVSLVFYNTVRSKKYLSKRNYKFIFQKG
jgi:hypothetical protein